MSLVVLAGCLCASNALVHSGKDKKFWPFTSWSEPAPAVKAQALAFVKHVAPAKPKPTEAPAIKDVKQLESEAIGSEKFGEKVSLMCKEAAAADQQKCKTVMGERMWCALFQRKRCNVVNSQEGAQAFMLASWELKPHAKEV